jgi:hypothetical protein
MGGQRFGAAGRNSAYFLPSCLLLTKDKRQRGESLGRGAVALLAYARRGGYRSQEYFVLWVVAA